MNSFLLSYFFNMKQVNIIHLEQDIGRFHHMQPLKKPVNGDFWNGEYAIKVDENGYSIKKIKDFTYCAKLAKYKLLKKFYDETDFDYIVVFEDDVVWHNKFYEYWNQILDSIKKIKQWKVIYMGVSTYLQQPLKIKSDIEFMKLPPGKIYTGAYAFFLHRDAIPIVLDRITDNNILQEPFDVTCLGYLQTKYRNECYLTNPQIILADVSGSNIRHSRKQDVFSHKINWNLKNYAVPNKIPFFIISCENVYRLCKKIKSINRLMPIVNPIIIQTTKYNSAMEKMLLEYKSQGIDYYTIRVSEENRHSKLLEFLNNFSILTKYFFISTTSIGFPDQLPTYFFDMIENDIGSKYSSINYISIALNHCKRCNPINYLSHVSNISPFISFSIIKTKTLQLLKSNEKVKTIDIGCYLLDTCKEISDNSFHNISRDDIVQYINYDSHMYDLYKIKKINTKFIKIIIDWAKWYFISEINKIIDNGEVVNNQTHVYITISNKYRKKFNTSEFRLMGISYQYMGNVLIVSLDNTTYNNIFGSSLFALIKHMCIKYGIDLYYIDINISFS